MVFVASWALFGFAASDKCWVHLRRSGGEVFFVGGFAGREAWSRNRSAIMLRLALLVGFRECRIAGEISPGCEKIDDLGNTGSKVLIDHEAPYIVAAWHLAGSASAYLVDISELRSLESGQRPRRK